MHECELAMLRTLPASLSTATMPKPQLIWAFVRHKMGPDAAALVGKTQVSIVKASAMPVMT